MNKSFSGRSYIFISRLKKQVDVEIRINNMIVELAKNYFPTFRLLLDFNNLKKMKLANKNT